MQKLYDYANCDVFQVEFILKNDNKIQTLTEYLSSCLLNTDSNELIVDFAAFGGIEKTENDLIKTIELTKEDIERFEYYLISVKDINVIEYNRSGNVYKTYQFKNKSNLIRLNTTKYYLEFEFSD